MNKINFLRFFTLLMLILSMQACKKDVEKWSDIPSITFESISPSAMQEYSEPVIIKIKYQDGDGDLGQNNTDISNTFVTDLRNQTVYSFRTRQLAPNDAKVSITGNLEIEIPTTWILNNSNQESVQYSVYLVDRAGHTSNTITTLSVQLSK